MKLSEMNTDQLAEALCALSGPVGEIARDEELNEAVRRMAEGPGGTVLEQAGALYAALAPALLGRHKGALYQALSALTGKSPADLAAQPGLETLRELRETVDGDLLRFFGCSGR